MEAKTKNMIEVNHVKRYYKVAKREKGFGAAVAGVFHRKYEVKKAVDDISFTIKRGEIVGFIGPNGAGKSTILKTIAKQLQEICGSVYVENTSLCELPEKELAKKMSIVFTFPHVIPDKLPIDQL